MGIPEDMTVISVDLVHFHVHQACILAASTNLFNGNVPIAGLLLQLSENDDEDVRSKDEYGLDITKLPECGSVINVLLFAVYNRVPVPTQVEASNVSLSDLGVAIVSLTTYGIRPIVHLQRCKCTPSQHRTLPTCTRSQCTPPSSCCLWTCRP